MADAGAGSALAGASLIDLIDMDLEEMGDEPMQLSMGRTSFIPAHTHSGSPLDELRVPPVVHDHFFNRFGDLFDDDDLC
ncbi:uncharacterized protein LOC143275344 isoform X2 [Babylonia areolata]